MNTNHGDTLTLSSSLRSQDSLPLSSSTIKDDFTWRGLLTQVTDPQLFAVLEGQRVTLYCGFDPTADSLHIGSLLPLVTLRRLQQRGHRVIALLGDATGMIGDPSGKSEERTLLSSEALAHNAQAIGALITKLLVSKDNPPLIVNNMQWFAGVEYIAFLRDVGKHFSVNSMMARESVKARLTTREQGISYTEFSYALLQAWDFYQLYCQYDCVLQVGGSDQWGNIASGVDLIRRLTQHDAAQDKGTAYGMTLPLLTKSDGSKFGKTEQGNIWLDAERTSPYDFYQFFMRVNDDEAVRLAQQLTFISPAEHAELVAQTKQQPEQRRAQQYLAAQLTEMVHGTKQLAEAQQTSAAFFAAQRLPLTELKAEDLRTRFADTPQSVRTDLGVALLDVLTETKLCASRGQARRDIAGGGIYLNDVRVSDAQLCIGKAQLLAGGYVVVRRGRKQHHVLRFEEK